MGAAVAPEPAVAGRRRFLARRTRALRASGVVIGGLAGLGVLLLLPDGAASVRLTGVGLAWWVAGLAVVGALVAVALALWREPDPLGPAP